MDIHSTLKKTRAQIKYGRVAEAYEILKSLLRREEETINEPLVLEVFALELLSKVKRHAEAIPLVERLLSLEISDEIRSRASSYLEFCKDEEKTAPSEPDVKNPDFVAFMNTLRKGEFFDFSASLNGVESYAPIGNLEKAKEIAWHQEIAAPYQSWKGLRTKASKEVHDHIFKNKLNLNVFLNEINTEIVKICDERIKSAMLHFYDEIYADLLEIARGKLFGANPLLHKKCGKLIKKAYFLVDGKEIFQRGFYAFFPKVNEHH